MESYSIFRDLAIIIIFAKVFGIIARKCKAPQVVGEIFAEVMGAEDALVRSQFQSGTHTLAVALFGLLRAGAVSYTHLQ